MGVLHATALTEYEKIAPDLHTVLELSLPGGTKRYASVRSPVASATNGLYKGKVVEWGEIARNASDPRGALQATETSVLIDDVDREFSQILEGSGGNSVLGSAAVIKEASANIAAANWPIKFSGVIDRYEIPSAFKWRFSFRPNDLPLRKGTLPKHFITIYDWPNAKPDVISKPVPIILGKHNSYRFSDKGACPLYYVDTTGFRYLVCIGWATSVFRVYKDGVLQSSAGWSQRDVTVNGRKFTLVDFTSDQGIDAAISADVYGLNRNAEFDGEVADQPQQEQFALMRNPVEEMRWLLANGVFNDWSGSTPYYVDADAPIDVASWDAAEAFCEARRYRGSSWIGDTPRSAIDILNEWAENFWLKLYWTAAGKLAVKAIDPSASVTFFSGSSQWIRYPRRGEEEQIALAYDTTERISRITVQHGLDANVGDYRGVLEVGDTLVADKSVVAKTHSWAESAAALDESSYNNTSYTSLKGYWPVNRTTGTDIGPGLVCGTLADQSGNGYNFTGAGNARPLLRAGHAYARAVLHFGHAGADDVMTSTLLSNLIANTAFTLFMVFKLRAVGTNLATIYQNEALIADTGGFWGLHLKNASGVITLNGYNWDGNADVVAKTIALDTWYVCRFRHYNGSIYLSVNNDAEVSAASGNTSDLTGTVQLGKNLTAGPAAWLNGDIAAAMLFNDGALYNLYHWDVYQGLADDFGVTLEN